jgi:hypothetical protein
VAHADSAEEQAVKTALVLNFARYTDWPSDALASSPGSLRVCIIGEAPLADSFQEIEGRTVKDRTISIRVVGRGDDPTSCDVLFVDSRNRRRLQLVFAAIRDLPVLTVGEMPDFIDLGGIINLYRVGNKIRFEVNVSAAERVGLKISARLLQLARVIRK